MRIFHLRQPAGASLIEILIALIVISVGMIGSAILQVKQLRQITQANADYTVGFQMTDIRDSMLANKVGVAAGYYKSLNFSNLASETETPCDTANCLPEVIAKNDAIRWAKVIAASLPNGTISITSVTANTYHVKIEWKKGSTTQTYERNITL
ncbi:MAG: pilV [Gammaproteobacteria bacterium]|jgi:type IV pilus assembly protein PilV|nr:pilV [Gammaproteobacteria bacterium]